MKNQFFSVNSFFSSFEEILNLENKASYRFSNAQGSLLHIISNSVLLILDMLEQQYRL